MIYFRATESFLTIQSSLLDATGIMLLEINSAAFLLDIQPPLIFVRFTLN